MAILLKLSTTLRDLVPGYDPMTGLELAWEPGLTSATIMTRLGIPIEDVRVVMRNGHAAEPEQPLADGDRVGLFPPLGGG